MHDYYPRTIAGTVTDEVQYLVEPRGGWDEWSDRYQAVVGISLPDGTEVMSTRVDGRFEDKDGNELTVEFPPRPDGYDISVERYEPDYDLRYFKSISQFNTAIEKGHIIFD